MRHTFLVEIGTEELPPKILRTLAQDFAKNITVELDSAHISYGDINWFATPRRLAVKINSLNSCQNSSNIREIGPNIMQAFDTNGKPTKVAEIWAHSCNITVDQADRITNDKGTWLIYQKRINGLPVDMLLCNIIINALGKLPIQKMMQWGYNNTKFFRPVHTITLLLDDKIIPGCILGINVNRIVLGHRFMGKMKINLHHANCYPQTLLEHGWVMADYKLRKETIRHNAEMAAQQIGGVADLNDNLLEEVTSLVEWPVVLTAHFEDKFLAIPIEALVYTMKKNQKYFPVYDIHGKLLPYFIFVANIVSKDQQQIIVGNEKVIRSRLADAEFFFNADRKLRLEDYLPSLGSMLFHKQLGTLRDKSDRIASLSGWIAAQIGANIQQSTYAGLLSKCDLMTNMVFEFPDTQGIMGMYYACYDGQPRTVALAQKEHYQPRFAGDNLPTTLVSCAVAIADKIDTLVGIFGIGQRPKGNNDPFALRRAALGILRIIVEKHLPLDLHTLIQEATCLYNDKLTNISVIDDVINFMLIRLYSWYQDQGYKNDTIQAVIACRPTQPIDFDARVRAVTDFRTRKEAKLLALVSKRVVNMLTKVNDPLNQQLQLAILKEPAEIKLATNILSLSETLPPLFEAGCYKEALLMLSTLCEPVDIFFKNIMVMVEDRDIRINRLTILDQLRKLLLKVADISLLS